MSQTLSRAVAACATLAALPACDQISEPKVVIEHPVELIEIPAIYRGHWSTSLDLCDHVTGDSSQWMFVGPETVGSFEHMYPVSEVTLFEDRLEFTSRFGDKYAMTMEGEGAITVTFQDNEGQKMVRCPDEDER